MPLTRSCPTCGPVEVADGVCPTCGWQFTEHGAIQEMVVVETARPHLPVAVDLAIAVDATGSTGAFERGVPLTVEGVVTDVARKVRDLRIWCTTYRDEELGERPELVTDAGSAEEAMADIRRIPYHGGGDLPETHLSGWRAAASYLPTGIGGPDRRPVLLALYTDTTKPLPERTPAEFGRELRERGVLVYLVGHLDPAIDEFLDAADGLFFEISNDPRPQDLELIASRVAASITATAGRPDATVPLLAPESANPA